MVESTPVAAVLIEYKSEGMDTEAVACHIKRRFPAKPIILLSAYADLPDRVLWLVDDYVMRSEPMVGNAALIARNSAPLAPVSIEGFERYANE